MSDILGRPAASAGTRFTRRQCLKIGGLAFGGMTVVDWLRLVARGQVRQDQAKARSVIQLWMGGGPSHLDTFDPKPGAGVEYCGPYRTPLATNVDGIQICETLPQMAELADKYSILRGMTHPSNGHETATYIMQTGTLPSGDLVYPSVGAVVAMKKEEQGAYRGSLPPYVMVTSALGRFSEAGFLGSRYQPFATGGDTKAKDFRVNGLALPAGMTGQRLQERRSLLEAVDSFAGSMDQDDEVRRMGAYQQKAYDLIQGEAKKAFDLSEEQDKVRDRYGRTTFGQSCLLARRLVENGVPFVTVNWGGWDTHKRHFEKMRDVLPVLDTGFSALLTDLWQRGLLESTIVMWGGEFGRTPRILKEPPWEGGRGHFAAAFSCVVAGGGFQGGKVVGATDTRGEKVIQRPVYPWDLAASMYKLLGIDPGGRLPHPQGRVVYVTPPKVEMPPRGPRLAAKGAAGPGAKAVDETAKGGLLTEIM